MGYMASEWSYKNQGLSYQGKFQWIFDQLIIWNLVRVSGEFELSEFELSGSTVYMYMSLNRKCFNPFAPGDFAEKRILKLVEWFSGHCRAIKS